MLLKPLTIVAAGLAAATNAFLLPPGALSDVNKEDKTFNALPFEIAKNAESQVVKVDCPGCPIVIKGQVGRFQMKHGSSHLELSFSIDHAQSSDRLLVNGFELYPHADPSAGLLTAAVMPDFKEDDGESGNRIPMAPKSLAVENQELGFSLIARSVVKDELTRTELISLDLQIIEVGNRFVNNLDTVHIELLKSEGGSLIVAKVEQIPADNDKEAEPKAPCTTMACKWKSFVNDYVKHFKPVFGCGGKMGGMGGHHMGHGHGKGPHHGQASVPAHHQSGHHGRPQYHAHHHSWGLLFKKFTHTILFPVLIGIVAGVSISLIGMAVGTVVIGVWRVFVRGQPFFRTRCHRRRGSLLCHKAPKQESALAEEKSSLMDDQEALPSYDDEEQDKRVEV